MIDSLRRVLQYAIEFLDIIPHSAKDDPDIATVSQMLVAYDALAPDWSQAPDGAQWLTIDADGVCCWHEVEPTPDGAKWRVIDPTDDCYWHEVEPTPDSPSWESGTADFAGFVFAIPLGVDWRLLKWQRPEVTP